MEHAGELAARLYAAFRDGEEAGLDVIFVEAVPGVGVGRAVMNRLCRQESCVWWARSEFPSAQPRQPLLDLLRLPREPVGFGRPPLALLLR